MDKLRKSFLYSSLFLVYTQGMWDRIFSLHPILSNAFVDLPILLFIFYPFKFRLRKTPGLVAFILFVFFSFISSYINQDGTYNYLRFVRYFIYFYLIFNQMWYARLSSSEWKNLFKFIIVLILLQGIGSAFNLFVLGVQVEGHVGLMSSSGGTTATTFPIIVLSLCLLMYLSYLPKNRIFNIIIILCIGSALLVSIQSGKRATYFLIPFYSAIVIFYTLYTTGSRVKYIKKLTITLIILVSLIPVFILGIASSRGLNYGLRGDESNIEIIENAIDYAIYYETNTARQGTTGRTGTTLMVLNNSLKSGKTFLLGYGIGSHKDEFQTYRLGIEYGFVGATRDLISVGWPSMILTIIIFLQVILVNKSYKLNFTNSIRLILLSVFLLIHINYASDYTSHLKIGYMLAILCAFINSPVHYKSLENLMIKYFR